VFGVLAVLTTPMLLVMGVGSGAVGAGINCIATILTKRIAAMISKYFSLIFFLLKVFLQLRIRINYFYSFRKSKKRVINKKLFLLAMSKRMYLIMLLLAFAVSHSFAMGISISPGTITLDNVLKGGYAESTFLIGNPNDVEIKVNFQVEGEVGKWLSFDPPSGFVLEPGEQRRVKVSVNVPSDTPNGLYSVIAVAAAEPIAQTEGTGAAISAAVGAVIKINVVGEEVLDLDVKNIKPGKLEEGYPLYFEFNIENTGNVKAKPVYEITVWDYENTTKYGEYRVEGEEILPFQERTDSVSVPISNLTAGTYWANIKLYLENKLIKETWKRITIFPAGTYSVNAILEDVYVPKVKSVNQLVEVVGKLNNTGEIPLLAKLKVESYMELIDGNKLVDVEYGDEVRVEPGEVKELTAYLRFKDEGSYLLKVKAAYYGKYSNEITKEIKITPGNIFTSEKVLVSLLIVLLIILLILVIILILKRKVRKR